MCMLMVCGWLTGCTAKWSRSRWFRSVAIAGLVSVGESFIRSFFFFLSWDKSMSCGYPSGMNGRILLGGDGYVLDDIQGMGEGLLHW